MSYLEIKPGNIHGVYEYKPGPGGQYFEKYPVCADNYMDRITGIAKFARAKPILAIKIKTVK